MGRTLRPHTLDPDALLRAHLTPFLAHQQSQLNAKIQTAQLQNTQLMEDIRSQRLEITNLMTGLEAALKDLEGAASEVEGTVGGDGKGGGLRHEALIIERELGAVD